MANEAIIVELLGNRGDPIDFVVPDTPGIAKGTIGWLTTARTLSGANVAASPKPIAGIVAAEKVAADGQIRLAAYTHGIFDLMVGESGGLSAGDMVMLSGSNTISGAGLIEGEFIGKALETGTVDTRCEVLVG